VPGITAGDSQKKKVPKRVVVIAWQNTKREKLHQVIQLKGQIIILENILFLIFFLRFID